MLLKYGLGEEKAALRIEAAVLDTLDRGYRTGDIYSAGLVGFFLYLLNLVFVFIFPSPFFSSWYLERLSYW